MPKGIPNKKQPAPGAKTPEPAPTQPQEGEAYRSQRGLLPQPHELAVMKEMVEVYVGAGFAGNFSDTKKAIAVALKGWEMGVPPLQALEGFYISEEGKLTMQADLMRSLVQRSGAGLIMVDSTTNDGAVVTAIRYGVAGRQDRESKFTFTMEDAKRAGLAGTTNWQKYPASLCVARATSQAARTIFPDVLMGVIYTPEEVGGEVVKPEPVKTPEPTPNPDAPILRAVEEAIAKAEKVEEAPAKAEEKVAAKEPEVVQPDKADPRPLVHSFQTEAPGGGVKVIRTSGVTQAQLKQIIDLTTARGGRSDWQALQALARGFITNLGFQDLRFLTEAEAEALINGLLTGEQAPTESRQRQQLREVLDAVGVVSHLEAVATIVARQYQVGSIDELNTPQLVQSLAEIKDLCRDPQAFILMVERSLQEMGMNR